ncbi:MAG: M48 family metallopeptidase, partial [Proteobacteria bacterium]|nr:M48 family metallopeptidase [Pseudomonadota bacterium]
GTRYLLNIIETDAPPKVILKNKTYIDLYVRPETQVEKRHTILTEWYRFELKKQIPEIIEKWEKVLNIKVNEWQVKQMKTKWGSCTIEKKRIWINLELAKKPDCCLEYIIVHEMVHLLERHHNDRFLFYMDTYLPNWKQLKTQLSKLPVSHADWNY